MGFLLPLLSSLTCLVIVVGANQAVLEPVAYWHDILPHTPIPTAIAKHLPNVHADDKTATSVNVGSGGVNVNTGKGTTVNVGHGGVGVATGNSRPGGTTVGVGKGGVDVHTGKGTSVTVGKGGVGVITGKSKPGGTTVGVGKGGVGVHTGKGTSVTVGKGGVGVVTGKSRPGGTTVGIGKGGVGVHTGKGTSVTVGKGGVGVVTGKSRPGGTTVGVGKGGVGVHTGKGTSVNVGKGGVGVVTNPKGKPVVVHVNPVGSPFDYNYAASDTQLNSDPAAALFSLRNDLRPGKQFTLQLADEDAVPATFIPRPTADAIPFSTSELPSILSHFNIPPGSGEAEAMKSTLLECETAPVAGERKRCATSLESMVEFATASLGTRDVAAVGTEGGGAAAVERRPYKVKAVRRAAAGGGKGVVACHPEAYPYTVFFCHATTTAEVYEVELAEEDGGMGTVKAVAVCHTDTARWNPKHLAFRALKVKPGTVAVCHFLPRDHVVWAGKV